MNPPSKDIAEFLEDSATGTGLTSGVDLFYSYVPDDPDTCIAILDRPGMDSESGYTYERPMIQVISRAFDYDVAYANIDTIKDALHDQSLLTINGTVYVFIKKVSDVGNLGEDMKKRMILSLNFLIHRTA